MKSLAIALVLVPAAAAAEPAHRAEELRQVLRQYHAGAAKPPPRQLTPQERAELRRQLAEYTPPRRAKK